MSGHGRNDRLMSWPSGTRGIRPAAFPMLPPPIRGTALQVLREKVHELLDSGAVDGATGDAVDGLIGAWEIQWLQELQPGLAARQALLEYLTGIALARHRIACRRAEFSRFALDEARAAYEAACTPASQPTTRAHRIVDIPLSRVTEELRNGSRLADRS